MDDVEWDSSPAATPSARHGAPRNSRRRRFVLLVLGALLCAGLFVLGREACYVLLGPNFHCVAPANAYRSGQPQAAWLDHAIDQHGIRSVINLRGDGHQSAWYVSERDV